MPKTSMHPDEIGNGSLVQTFTQHFKRSTGTNDESCLYISFNPNVQAGMYPSVTPHAATVAVSATGAGANKARITLAVKNHNASGAANSDVSFTIDCDGTANGAWSSGNVTVLDIKGIIDAINSADAGGTSGKLLGCFHAWVKDAPYDLAVTTASMFATESAQYILPPGTTGTPTTFLKRDLDVHQIDSDYILYKRIGFPEERDRGLFKFVDIFGAVTGTTSGSLKIYRDDYDDYVAPSGTYATDMANHELLYQVAPANLSTARGSTAGVPAGAKSEPETWRGPVIVEVKSDDVSAVDLRVAMQAVS